jgi:hypothetical protein
MYRLWEAFQRWHDEKMNQWKESVYEKTMFEVLLTAGGPMSLGDLQDCFGSSFPQEYGYFPPGKCNQILVKWQNEGIVGNKITIVDKNGDGKNFKLLIWYIIDR